MNVKKQILEQLNKCNEKELKIILQFILGLLFKRTK